MAENKTTAEASSRKLTRDINKKLEERGIIINKSSVYSYLNDGMGKQRSIRPVFALNDKQRDKRVKYCQKLIDKGILGKNIFLLMKHKLNALLQKINKLDYQKRTLKN